MPELDWHKKICYAREFDGYIFYMRYLFTFFLLFLLNCATAAKDYLPEPKPEPVKESLVKNTYVCFGYIEDYNLSFTYSQNQFQTDDVWAKADIVLDNMVSLSSSEFWTFKQGGSIYGNVSITLDLYFQKNNGYWSFGLDRDQNILYVSYYDPDKYVFMEPEEIIIQQEKDSWEFPDRCLKNLVMSEFE